MSREKSDTGERPASPATPAHHSPPPLARHPAHPPARTPHLAITRLAHTPERAERTQPTAPSTPHARPTAARPPHPPTLTSTPSNTPHTQHSTARIATQHTPTQPQAQQAQTIKSLSRKLDRRRSSPGTNKTTTHSNSTPQAPAPPWRTARSRRPHPRRSATGNGSNPHPPPSHLSSSRARIARARPATPISLPLIIPHPHLLSHPRPQPITHSRLPATHHPPLSPSLHHHQTPHAAIRDPRRSTHSLTRSQYARSGAQRAPHLPSTHTPPHPPTTSHPRPTLCARCPLTVLLSALAFASEVAGSRALHAPTARPSSAASRQRTSSQRAPRSDPRSCLLRVALIGIDGLRFAAPSPDHLRSYLARSAPGIDSIRRPGSLRVTAMTRWQQLRTSSAPSLPHLAAAHVGYLFNSSRTPRRLADQHVELTRRASSSPTRPIVRCRRSCSRLISPALLPALQVQPESGKKAPVGRQSSKSLQALRRAHRPLRRYLRRAQEPCVSRPKRVGKSTSFAASMAWRRSTAQARGLRRHAAEPKELRACGRVQVPELQPVPSHVRRTS